MSKPENEKLWEVLSKLRGVELDSPEELATLLQKENVHLSAHDLITSGYILATRFRRPVGNFFINEWLAAVFAALISGVSPKTLCDPWAGIGILLKFLQEASRSKEAIAITLNRSEHALGSVLVPDVDWRCGDPLQFLCNANKELDVVASILPMGVRTTKPQKIALPSGEAIELIDDLGHLILIASSLRLSSSGVGLFVVSPSFFVSPRSVFRKLSELGLGAQAAFALPPGTFAPYTNISTYLTVIQRKPSAQMFAAQLSADTNTNREIIHNFQQKIEGASVELGRFVACESFTGITAIRTAEKLALASRNFGAPSVSLGELATAITLGRTDSSFVFQQQENAIFVPLIGKSNVMESLDDLTLKKQNYAQVVIDRARSYARFVASFLNSDLGKELREASKSGTYIPKLNKQTLQRLLVFVPDLSTQQRMLEIETNITAENNTVMALQNELTELRRELWANPNAASHVKQQLGKLATRLAGEVKQHTSENLEQWFETLPFPLASILRAWQATPSQDYKTKYEHLLHFFEATAEFISVILLSAFGSNEALFEPHKSKLKEAMAKQNQSFIRPTFGTWKLVIEYLGKQTRQLLSENEKRSVDVSDRRALCADSLLTHPFHCQMRSAAMSWQASFLRQTRCETIGLVMVVWSVKKRRNNETNCYWQKCKNCAKHWQRRGPRHN